MQDVRRALVSSSKPCRVVVFAGKMEVELLGLGPDICDLVDLQLHFDSLGRKERRLTRKTLPPLPITYSHYSLKRLSKALLDLNIQEGTHNALEDARATMELFNWGKTLILSELVSY